MSDTTSLPFLTVGDVGELLAVQSWRIVRLFETGILPEPPRSGGRRMIPKSQVADIVDALRKKGWLSKSASGSDPPLRYVPPGDEWTTVGQTKREKLSPPQIARAWGVSPDKVLTWIRTGELRAIDASTRRSGRPRYLVDVGDLARFEAARAVMPLPKTSRKRKKANDVIEFF